MFDQLVKQASRLYSTKKNVGKQVPKLTDRLHTRKLVIFALCIALVLGYKQFREYFLCQAADGIDAKIVTQSCLINGTTTIVDEHQDGRQVSPHAGFMYITNKDHRRIDHNYIRSLWYLLVLLAVCSYFAQRRWASIFQSDVLKALLKLHGSEESKLVRAAESAKPYEMLSKVSNNLNTLVSSSMNKCTEMSRADMVVHKINIVDDYLNVYDHQLDYYANQMTYILLTKSSAAYKMSGLKLRGKLIMYSLTSTCATMLQFLLPLIFIGNEYMLYGWYYLLEAVTYFGKLIQNRWNNIDAPLGNAIDYNLSARIFPILTHCEFKQFGVLGTIESATVQCTVGINELAGKLFVVIWWFVAVNIIVELSSLTFLLLCSINSRAMRFAFGLRYWPGAKSEANLIASFRHRRLKLLIERRRRNMARGFNGKDIASAVLNKSSHIKSQQLVDECQRKQLEAEGEQTCNIDIASSLGQDEVGAKIRSGRGGTQVGFVRWHIFASRIVNVCVQAINCCSEQRRARLENENDNDINVYYVLYLLYLRLGESKSRVEEVIKMTSQVLTNYLNEFETQNDDAIIGDNPLGDGSSGSDKQQTSSNATIMSESVTADLA